MMLDALEEVVQGAVRINRQDYRMTAYALNRVKAALIADAVEKRENAKKKKVRITARWTNYGPKYYAGRNERCDCEGDVNSWDLASFGLHSWLENNYDDATPEFVGESAEAAEEAYLKMLVDLEKP